MVHCQPNIPRQGMPRPPIKLDILRNPLPSPPPSGMSRIPQGREYQISTTWQTLTLGGDKRLKREIHPHHGRIKLTSHRRLSGPVRAESLLPTLGSEVG